MNDEKRNWLDHTPIPALPWLTVETLIFALILLAAVVTRFYNLGARAMSHDESLHTYFSYLLYKGQGYQHNPMMHGPLQFHLIALAYFLFGASDFVARMPAATFSILGIASLWIWRRYLGRAGMLAAAFMVLISPFLLYYARYTREDSYVMVSLFVMLYGILRYFETGGAKYIYMMAGALVIHYLTKETSFIYTAQILIFLAIYFLSRVLQKPWANRERNYRGFLVALFLGLVLLGATGYVALTSRKAAMISGTQTAAPANPTAATPFSPYQAAGLSSTIILAGVTLLVLAAALFFLIRGFGLENIRKERSFDLLIVFGTIVLPMLSAFPVYLLGWNPLDYTSTGLLRTGLFLGPIILITVAIGFWWNREVWWKMALIFWGPYILLYTTVFTNGAGFFTGTVGSLGYWLEQQGVQRGSQPLYYYLLITVPIYEFLPALACILAAFLGLRRQPAAATLTPTENQELDPRTNMLSLLGWWTVTSIIALTVAGEKMPWLTFHIVLPMVLWGGWAIGNLIDRVDWADLAKRNYLLVLALLAVFTLSVFGVFIALLGSPAPFEGQELSQLQATTSFIFAILAAVASGYGLYRLLLGWEYRQALSLGALVFFGILAVLTMRASFRASYLTYNSAREYLVYAHSYSGVKDALKQIDDLSEKTVGGKDIVVAYDDDTSWPMSWYMREYPNARFYGAQPDRSLREVPAIIVGDNNYSKMDPIVGDNYYRFDYIRMVWPNQDYFNLVNPRPEPGAAFDPGYPCTGLLSGLKLFRGYDFSRVCGALNDPRMRSAMFDIWLNRDYKLYGEVTGSQGINETTWDPSDKMRLYIRKDVADKVWNYGIKTEPKPKEDPYAKGVITLAANLSVGSLGTEPGQFNAPRGIAFAPDGSLYVADSRNHRIQHLGADGKVIKVWGTFADQASGNAPIGTFNEPWGVAVSPTGDVYVSDTWNHRIQKFSADGTPVKMWGVFGTAETPGALYGPRGIAVDAQGKVYVADTGNKRIVVYDSNGAILTEFGSEGFDPGQFSEPVDVKVDTTGKVYVTDTWNQRVQVLASVDGKNYAPLKQWPISGWVSQSLDNKPYITVRADGHVFVTDPEGYRVIEFTNDGQFVQLWGQFGTDNATFGLPNGIASDPEGNLWVADAGNNRLMRFSVPAK
ncbi:MAG TPA: flippase activity-associated protein Agl23 [Anaerolineales bacterium]|jgi:predicted membrane-bound mannosyltransferase/sugar lactone lactonase YvrE